MIAGEFNARVGRLSATEVLLSTIMDLVRVVIRMEIAYFGLVPSPIGAEWNQINPIALSHPYLWSVQNCRSFCGTSVEWDHTLLCTELFPFRKAQTHTSDSNGRIKKSQTHIGEEFTECLSTTITSELPEFGLNHWSVYETDLRHYYSIPEIQYAPHKCKVHVQNW